jgi:hypothetical protein
VLLRNDKIYVILHKQANKEDFLKSYIHALVAASFSDTSDIKEAENQSHVWMQKSYPLLMLEVRKRMLLEK